jgi:nucleotide-binding universal stress UspA family protein
MSTIVVGLDHSEGARAALRFAVAEAKLRGSTLRAVHAWQFAYATRGMEGSVFAPGLPDIGDVRSAAEAVLDDVLAGARDLDGIAVERRVVEGTAGAVLVAESREADLLVVGSRGHGGFAGLLLGSVGAQCAHHAACPVVIIPHQRG